MRTIIRNIADLSDSREVMEARTHPGITIFITILIILLAVACSWSFIGEIDEVAKASGVVRPNDKVSGIQTSALGTVDAVHVQEGQLVEKGDLLISLEHQELQMELNNREEELARLDQDIELLERYMSSIQQQINLFHEASSKEQFYYHLVEQFLLEYSSKQFQYESGKRQIEEALGETVLAGDAIQLNIRSNRQKTTHNQAEYERRIEEVEQELELEKLLEQSLSTKTIILPVADSLRLERLQHYQLRIEQLTQAIVDSQSKYEQSAALGERFVAKSALEEQQAQVETLRLQLEQFKQEAIMGVRGNVDAWEKELTDLNRSLELLYAEDAPALLEQEALKLEEAKLNEKRQNLQAQGKLLDNTGAIEMEKFKLDTIVQIQATIQEKENSRLGVADRIQQLSLAQEKQMIVSPMEGTVHVLKELNAGTIVQAGEPLLSIIPADEAMYKMNIAVPNHEIGQIAVGNKVDLNFHAFPKQSFGSLTGTVTSISTDATMQQDGRSYYIVEASIANEPLVNRKGEHGEVRIGMTAEAYIITDSKKIIHFILEKINLRE